MKILKQFTIIFSIAALGDFISKYFNLPIPGNVIGMFLLFLTLLIGIIKESHIAEVSDFLLTNLVFFFIPGGLGIINEFEYLKDNIAPFIIICILIVFIIISSTGLTAELLEKLFKKRHEKSKDIR